MKIDKIKKKKDSYYTYNEFSKLNYIKYGYFLEINDKLLETH